MNLQVGEIQDISIHGVASVSIEDTSTLESSMNKNNKYYRTMIVRTESGQYIEITLFSREHDILKYKDK
mgnify:CR=1 FL=1